ncbi:MAG: NAD(+)/NADH kinase [Candidatus Hydrogenedentes bacterium]|nr:NAD(+)/NADH kinase [Candidatus Hydrogenedentota bacterium]
MKILLYGAESGTLKGELAKYPDFDVVDDDPDVVVSYGGDGTLLSAELQWPGVPKVPIKNSRRGIRCMPHPPAEVIGRLASNRLVRTEFLKLECALRRQDQAEPACYLTAMNEFNVHMGRINSAVRYRLYVDGEAYDGDDEIIGDGFVVSTPFGSTAYFNHLTRGVFHAGIGIAFKAPTNHTSHVVVPDTAVVRVVICRGPAVLAFDNSTDYRELDAGDELSIRRHAYPAVVYTWQPMSHPSDKF